MVNKPWQNLKQGDIVDIIAPSSNIPGDLQMSYQKIKEILSEVGLVARIPEDMIIPGADLFSTNSLEYRAKHLIDALTNTESKAVWPIRGGYGAAKLIPFLEEIVPPTQAKLLLGFSDITALHLFLDRQWGWSSLHSPVMNQLISNPDLMQYIEPIIIGEHSISYKLVPLNAAARQENIIEVEAIGGNLSIVQTSIGTSWQIQAKNRIIFLEEVGERGYRIDRMLHHLYQAGIFKDAKAVIFGEMTPALEPDGSNLCDAAIDGFAELLDIPVFHFPFIGHSVASNLPLPLGVMCSLKTGEVGELSCVL